MLQRGDRGETSWFWGRWSALGLGVAAATLIADQVSKWWMIVVFEIAERGRVSVAPFLDLVFVVNKGISYGIFTQDSAGGQWLLSAFSVGVAVVLAIWLARSGSGSVMASSVGMIIGGALGNAIDRVHLGGVADFFSLHAFGFYWYVFNIADAAIVAGVAGLLYDTFIAPGVRSGTGSAGVEQRD